jgi:hypothetical protein
MTKAHITTSSGISIIVEGTPKEVAQVVAKLKGEAPPSVTHKKRPTGSAKSQSKATPANLVAELIDGGFFKKPKGLGAVKIALEEQGHYYPMTSLSPTMLRFVRRRQLRRIKDKKRWLYVGG